MTEGIYFDYSSSNPSLTTSTRNWDELLYNDHHTITPQEISDFDQYRREQREQLTIYHHPWQTLRVCFLGFCSLCFHSFRYVLYHQVFLYLCVPIVILWSLLTTFPGPHSLIMDQIIFIIQYIIWWVGLGILSSIGLGSGLQSGVLFLFPHIFNTCLAAQTCGTLDFDSASDMWFRSTQTLFKCPPSSPSLSSHSLSDPTWSDHSSYDHHPVTFWGMWKKVILVCFLQSAGTAIGEIPPYWMTRAARLAALETSHNSPSSPSSSSSSSLDEIPDELESNSQYSFINYAKETMVVFLRKHGFWGVLLMASYPNVAFDLCGICCGHFLMPFWSFFLATFIGKAIIRNSYQSFVYVMLCSEEHLEMLISLLQYLVPDKLELDHTIREILEDSRQSFQSKILAKNSTEINTTELDARNSAQTFAFWWQLFTGCLLTFFLLSCLSHFAQYYQLMIDRDDSHKLRKRLPPATALKLMSPTSGKLHLPPPTPKSKVLQSIPKEIESSLKVFQSSTSTTEIESISTLRSRRKNEEKSL
eukprot:gene6839-7559_t